MPPPNLNLTPLYVTGFEDGTLDAWTPGGNQPPLPTISIVTTPIHTGTYALQVSQPPPWSVGWARHDALFGVNYIALDGWIAYKFGVSPGALASALAMVDVNGNVILMKLGADQSGMGLYYNGALMIAVPGVTNPSTYYEERFEFDYGAATVYYWFQGVYIGAASGLAFGPPSEVRIVAITDGFNTQVSWGDDVVISGIEDVLWKRRRRRWS